ncbi:MAG: hypothetical protein HQK55_05205 [Deltaproteobacteria bacterium]|nr:hypothetical protein [Deltaproteobacteria bacterium]
MKLLPDARTILALGITLTALIGITYLSVRIIENNADSTKAQLVLNAVLPLFGTWVGTVLAYYFSRDNFEAAAYSTERLVEKLAPEERLSSIPLAKVMIKKMLTVNDLTMKIVDIIKKLEDSDDKRYLPILKASGALEALVYREGLMSYLYNISKDEQSKKTLADLLKEKPELKQIPACVRETGTLSEAKEVLEKIENCKVVFVTRSGAPNDPILGMLTNTDISKYSRA